MTPDEKFGQSVQEARESRGWSMTHLAALLDKAGLNNFHAATIGRMERAERPVRLSEAVVIAEVLEKPLEDLLGGASEEQRMGGRLLDHLHTEVFRRGQLGEAFDMWLDAKSLLKSALRMTEDFGVDRVEAVMPGFSDETIPAAERALTLTLADAIDEYMRETHGIVGEEG